MQHYYICHTNYEDKTMDARPISIKVGERLTRSEAVLFYHDIPICVYRSYVAKKHFAPDDDHLGLERGGLAFTIAHDPRERYSDDRTARQRFTDEEIKTLRQHWSRFLKPGDTILFNDLFFEEKPEVLRQVAKSINLEGYYV